MANRSCKVFCFFCDKAVNLSSLLNHLRYAHKKTLTQYKELFGNPRMQIIEVVFHKCNICRKSVLLNSDDISKHLKKKHSNISYKDYVSTHLNNNKRNKAIESLVDEGSEKMLTGTGIQCNVCLKSFKQNIQLKIPHCGFQKKFMGIFGLGNEVKK